MNFRPNHRSRRSGRDLAIAVRRAREGWRQSWRLLIAGLWSLVLIAAPAEGAELVMFEALACEWCEVWDEEVGVVYHKTVEGRLAPLRRISIHETRPADLRPIAGVRYSPTFVLIDGGYEVGRIVGYPGEDHFWGLLQVLLDDLPQSSGPKPKGGM